MGFQLATTNDSLTACQSVFMMVQQMHCQHAEMKNPKITNTGRKIITNPCQHICRVEGRVHWFPEAVQNPRSGILGQA